MNARTTISPPAPHPVDHNHRPLPAPVGRSRLLAAVEQLPPETIEAIAQRVAELLRDHPPSVGGPRLVTAEQLAHQLGLTRAWVYQHAQDLGAIRLGQGPKARLRFNPATAASALEQQDRPGRPTGPTPPGSANSRGRPRRQPAPSGPLLPIRGQRALAAGVPSWAARRNKHQGLL